MAPFDPRLSRRMLLSALLPIGVGGLTSMLATRVLAADGAAAGATAARPGAKAKACIVLWLNGGPSHIDTFDPKPGQPTARFKSIKTRARGLELCEHLPLLADHGDRLAVVRSMTSAEGNHDRARYLLHTGYSPNPTVRHPSLGGWVSQEIGSKSAELPNFVSIGGPSLGAGFLGLQNGPFILDNPGQPPQNVTLPKNVDDARFADRRVMLDHLEERFAGATGDPQIPGRQAIYEQAVRMMQSPKIGAFDVAGEPEALKRSYGDSKFGRGCLVARRLVEAGVKLVEVVLDGWDTHQDNFERTKKLMGTLDPAFSTLLHDLGQRKLLDSTLVVCMGEFGRTPRINPQEGRDHFPAAWSAVLAGGGTRGGQAFGKTNEDGSKVVDSPIAVPHLFATMTTLLGLDPNKTVTSPIGRPIGLTDDGVAVRALML
jgi:hypothetical protein